MTADKRIDGSKMELFTLNWGGMLIEFVRADKFLKLEYDNLALIVEKDDLIKRVIDKSKQVGCLSDKVKFLDEQNITFGIQNTELRREIVELKAELYRERLRPDTSSLGETINDILNYVPPSDEPKWPLDEIVKNTDVFRNKKIESESRPREPLDILVKNAIKARALNKDALPESVDKEEVK